LQQIEVLQRQISQKSRSKGNKYAYYWSIAAGILILVSIGSYFIFRQPELRNESVMVEQTAIMEMEEQASESATVNVPPPVIVKDESVEAKMVQAEVQLSDIASVEEPALEIQNDSKGIVASAIPKTKTNLVKGKVVDETGEPIIGATILFAGTNNGTVTDLDGNFELAGSNKDKLNISYIGYEPVTLPIDTGMSMLIAMNESQQTLSEVVVTGYATMKKADMTGSVSKISMEKEKFDDYVKRALIHPTDEECKEAKGDVTLRFYVDENGRPYDITVKKSLCPSADKEAIRLVEEGPDWSLTDKELTKKISF
jgi:outer membrane biosynthesis protein TonB